MDPVTVQVIVNLTVAAGLCGWSWLLGRRAARATSQTSTVPPRPGGADMAHFKRVTMLPAIAHMVGACSCPRTADPS